VEEIPHRDYADAVLAELEMELEAGWSLRSAQTVYFGGGTPSLWKPSELARVIQGIDKMIGIDAGAEITIEANPGASDVGDLKGFRAAGVNRISFGTQSFHARGLRALGRWHKVKESLSAVDRAQQAGFDNVSLDLIYGTPNQSKREALEDVARAVDCGPDHISAYALTLDANVPMAVEWRAGRLRLPGERLAEAIEVGVQEALNEAGYERYEISNYAKEGREARHNNFYWTGVSYLGLGCAAAGFRQFEDGSGERSLNVRTAQRYLEKLKAGQRPQASREQLDAKTLLRERLFLGLRLVRGVDLEELGRWSGVDVQRDGGAEGAAIKRLVAKGLLSLEGQRLKPTPLGLRFHNEIALAFV